MGFPFGAGLWHCELEEVLGMYHISGPAHAVLLLGHYYLRGWHVADPSPMCTLR